VLARLVVAVDTGTYRREGEQASIASDETLGQFIAIFKRDWVERRKLSQQSLAAMLSVVDKGLGGYTLKHLAGDDGPPLIEAWLNKQQDERGWSAATWNHYRSLLYRLFARARKWKHVRTSNPVDFIDSMVVERDAPNAIRIEEDAEERLLAACDRLDEVQVRRNRCKLTWAQVEDIRRRVAAGESQRAVASALGTSPATVSQVVNGKTWNAERAAQYTKGREMRRRVIAAFDLGLRRTEMCNVTLSMVDFTPAQVEVDGASFEVLPVKLPSGTTKGGKRTGLPEFVYAGTDRVKQILLERRQALGGNPPERQFVFGREDGRREASFDRSAERLFELAGLDWDRNEGVVWHTLRHEFVSRTLEQSGDPVIAQAMARHKDGKTTQGYLHARPRRLLEAAVRLGRPQTAPPAPQPAEAAQPAEEGMLAVCSGANVVPFRRRTAG